MSLVSRVFVNASAEGHGVRDERYRIGASGDLLSCYVVELLSRHSLKTITRDK